MKEVFFERLWKKKRITPNALQQLKHLFLKETLFVQVKKQRSPKTVVCKAFLSLCFIFLFLLTTYYVSGQTSGENLSKEGDSLFTIKQYEVAITVYDSAYHFFRESINIPKSLYCLMKLGFAANNIRDYQQTIDKIENRLPFFRTKAGLDSFMVAKILLLKSVAYRNLKNDVKALSSYEEAIEIYTQLDTVHSNIPFAYKNAASIYERQLNYEKAITYFVLSIKNDFDNKYLAKNCKDLASCYFYLENYSKVIEYFQKGLESNPNEYELALLHSVGAAGYLEKGNLEVAESLARKALIFNKKYPDDGEALIKDYVLLVDILLHKKQDEEAFKLIQEAEKIAKKVIKAKSREVAKFNTLIGEFFKKKGNLTKALHHYQQALTQVFPNFNSLNIADNPPLVDLYPESWIMTTSARKAQALKYRYDQNEDLADLYNASACYDLSIAGVRQLKKTYGSDAAKIYLGDYSHAYFEEAIEVNYLLYEKTKEVAWLEKALNLMEQSKASALTDALQKNKAIIFAGLPDSLLQREEELRLSIADCEKMLQTAAMQEAKEAQLTNYQMQLSQLRLEHERLLENLKRENPKFRELVETPDVPTIAVIRSKLMYQVDEVFEFFVGAKAIYVLRIGQSTSDLYKIERTEKLNQQLNNYLSAFARPETIANDFEDYLANAHLLARTLFPNLEEFTKHSAVPHILLIPDGILNYLPFDALVFQKEPIQYFIHQANIHSGYSATVLLSQLESPKSEGHFLHLAPLFSKQERGMTPLLFSEEEVVGLQNLNSLREKEATLQNFFKQASQSKIIHFSTHAEGGGDASLPRIEFYDSTLYLPQLYALNLSADLVVLSACETNLGEIEKGEGVMSLARGFTYAGAKSLIASLWKVNDHATATLVSELYRNLKTGCTKAEALRLAKLNYLNETTAAAKKSPWYWAGFVYIGNDSIVNLDRRIAWYYWVLGIGAIGLFFVLIRNKNSAG